MRKRKGQLAANAAPSFTGWAPASPRASKAARGASKKIGTRCELVLRHELWRRGLRYRLNVRSLPGKPDIVFIRKRVAVFCDGDFWHGRDQKRRIAKLTRGHNAPYWIAKIRRNVARDLQYTRELELMGWIVIRLWETDIIKDPTKSADHIINTLLAVDAPG